MNGSVPEQLIHVIPNSYIDDFFLVGYISGMVGYAWYLYTNKNDPKNHISIFAGFYGTILSGALGGLLAIAIDRSYAISIIVGLLNQLIYMALLRSARSKVFWEAIRDVFIKYITMSKV